MKNIKLFYGITLAVLLMIACSKSGDLNTNKPDEISSELREYIKCLGFDEKNIRVVEDNLILEGDIIIPQKLLLEKMSNPDNNGDGTGRQYALNTTAVMSYTNSGNISYFIDASVGDIPGNGADWVTAINQAATDWNNIASCQVNFTQVFTAVGAELTFFADNSTTLVACGRNLGANTFAAAKFPVSNNIGDFIAINDNGPLTDLTGKISIIRHEIGHALGFRHSDMYNRVGSGGNEGANSTGSCGQQVLGGNLLHGTPDRDLTSVMVSATDGFTNINFNNFDIRAAQQLYPDNCCNPAINFLFTEPTGFGGRSWLNINSSYPIGWHSVRYEITDLNGAAVQNFTVVAIPNQTDQLLLSRKSGTFNIVSRGVNYRGDFVGQASAPIQFSY
jgi:Dual-action HEIGH metallo-peptidase